MSKICRGALILIEGVDRSGKSTQCAKLLASLNNKGIHAQLMRFPDRETKVGGIIANYLQEKCELHDKAIHLLFSANRWEKADEINKALLSGTTVLLDRYYLSGVVFSAAKGLDMNWCLSPDIGLPKPDAVFFLDVSPEVARTRGGYGEERYEKEEFQKKVKSLFLSLQDESWTIFNADQSVDTLHEEIVAKSIQVQTNVKEQEISFVSQTSIKKD
eukprot:c7774_g1_i1.p1 GENE.c7774_g1_i1~~c7774_g1_i1.p1  ORF type:complete len:216 (+),score=71.05 c7774_g1_i1:58-705(+)